MLDAAEPLYGLGRVCMAQGKQDEAVGWLRELLALDTDQTGKLIARPADRTSLDHLGDALLGKGDPDQGQQLLIELDRTLDWLTWKSDWFKHYVKALRQEAAGLVE
jgi:hypothetical protein